jgi:tRNA-dihydrouridine synthase
VVYGGRVTHAAQAERILAAGEADLVSMARATMADPDLVSKIASGDERGIRPCIALNECIHRKQIEGLPYACGVSPRWGRERTVHTTTTSAPRDVLVVGGGPAAPSWQRCAPSTATGCGSGSRSRASAARSPSRARLRGNRRYAEWIDYQAARLERVGVVGRARSHRHGRRRPRGRRLISWSSRRVRCRARRASPASTSPTWCRPGRW